MMTNLIRIIRKRLKHFFATEGAKLREMTFQEKRSYIWMYYKIQIIAAVFLIFMFGSLINTWFINPPKQEYLYIAWLGEFAMPTTLDNLADKLSVIVTDPNRQAVAVTSYAETGDPQMDMALSARFFGRMQTESLDLVLLDYHELNGLASMGAFRPVRDIAQATADNPVLYQKITERMVTITYVCSVSDVEITEMIAISLTGVPFLENLGLSTEDLFLTMIFNSENIYETAKAMEVIFGMWTEDEYQ